MRIPKPDRYEGSGGPTSTFEHENVAAKRSDGGDFWPLIVFRPRHLCSFFTFGPRQKKNPSAHRLTAVSLSRPLQLIQTVTAVDADEPRDGQHFFYSLAPEAANNPNFTLKDNQGSAAKCFSC